MTDFIDDNSGNDDVVAAPTSDEPAAPRELPVLPLRNSVLYPQVTIPFGVGREESILAVEAALLSEDKHLFVFAHRHSKVEQPSADDLYEVGTEAVIKHMVRGKDGLNLVLQGVERVQRVEAVQAAPYLVLRAESLPLPDDKSPETEALLQELMKVAARFHELSDSGIDVDFGQFLSQLEDPLQMVFMLGAMLV
jgi:ATP-dependent Lon protease